MRTSGLSRRTPHAWIASAKWSFPTPDSPRRRMLTSWSRIFSTVCRSVRIAEFFVRTKSFSSASRTLLAAGIPRRFCFRRELRGHVRRITPQPLQAVEAPAILGENVNDEVAGGDENAAAGRRSVDEPQLAAFGAPHPSQAA